MTSTPHPAKQAADVRALAERCGRLRLACWYLPVGSDELTAPSIDPEPLGYAETSAGVACLHAATLREEVHTCARGWLSDVNVKPEPAEMEPGCWLVPAFVYHGRRVAGIVVGLSFDAGATDQPWFIAHCRDVGVDPRSAAHGLSAFIWPGQVDLGLLAGALKQTLADADRVRNDQEAIELFSEQLTDTYEQTNLLFSLARLMNSLQDPTELIPTCCEQMLPVMPFRWIMAMFWDGESHRNNLTGVCCIAGELPCELDRFKAALTNQFGDIADGDWPRLQLPDHGGVAGLVGSEVIVEPIMHDGHSVGVLLAGNKRGDDPMLSDVTSSELQFIDTASNMLGVLHENVLRYDDLHMSFLGTLKSLTAAIDAKDPYTRGHSERVAYLGAELAKAMGMTPEQVQCVHITGLVHDVGKIGVPEAVLCKPGRLTHEEFEIIKRHPQIGYDILGAIPSIEPMLPGVLHHHERWDGHGYPHGLSGTDIPLLGRLLALADTFDAMSSTRSYRPALPRDKVLAEIEQCTGTQFDPDLAPLFVKLNFDEYDRMVEHHKSLSQSAA